MSGNPHTANPLFDLSGKTALIFGSGETGTAIAEALGRAGTKIVFAAPDGHALASSRRALQNASFSIDSMVADPSIQREADQVAQKVEREHGRIDILINASERFIWKPALDLNPEDWRESVRIHIKGVFLACQAVGKLMLKNGSGSIINLSSMAASLAFPGSCAFAACKGGVDQLTRTLGVEWMARGVRVNSIASWSDGFHDNLDAIWIRRNPLGRLVQPKELAGAVIYLASSASSAVTGQVICVDGGYSAQ